MIAFALFKAQRNRMGRVQRGKEVSLCWKSWALCAGWHPLAGTSICWLPSWRWINSSALQNFFFFSSPSQFCTAVTFKIRPHIFMISLNFTEGCQPRHSPRLVWLLFPFTQKSRRKKVTSAKCSAFPVQKDSCWFVCDLAPS